MRTKYNRNQSVFIRLM